MAATDLARWNQKYRAGNPNPGFLPERLLEQHVHLLGGQGLALDLACGVGHNALYLARCGYEVLAVDGSIEALRYGRAAAHAAGLAVQFVVADLEQFALPASGFDVAVVFRFLDRTLFPALVRSLRAGGVLMYQTYNTNWLRERPGFNPSYLLKPGELAVHLSELEPVAGNDDPHLNEPLSYWIARRPAESRRR